MRSPLLRLVLIAVVGFPVGVALTFWLGYNALNVIVLAAGAIGAGLAAERSLPARSRPLVLAFAVQGGHAVWLLAGALVLGQWGGLIDVLALAIPLVWLGRRPERRPAVVLLGVHAVETLLHLVQWARADEPALQIPWLVSHVSLRVAGALLTVRALQTIWRREMRVAPRPAVELRA